jgi:hypothetical protein
MNDIDVDDMITVDEACAIVGGRSKPIDRSTYYRGVRNGIYPAPIKVSPNIARVRRRQLLQSIERRLEAAS